MSGHFSKIVFILTKEKFIRVRNNLFKYFLSKLCKTGDDVGMQRFSSVTSVLVLCPKGLGTL